jgi:elongation factor 1-alpha
METKRIKIDVGTMGHVHHGKSTLLGFLLRELGKVDDDEWHTIVEQARKLNRKDLTYAFVLERLPEERTRGLTLEPYHYGLRSDKYEFMLIDCPGHADYVRSMIVGTTQADAGVLVIAADEYDNALLPYQYKDDKWTVGQAREHAFIARVLGIKQLIVVISKMDLVRWDQTKYLKIQEETAKLLTNLGFNSNDLMYVPVGGKPPDEYGINVISKPQGIMQWFNGPTFLESLNSLTPPPRAESLPLRIPIERGYSLIAGTELVLCGKVETGIVDVGDKIIVQPAMENGEIRSIRMRDEASTAVRDWVNSNQVGAGAVVGLGVRMQQEDRSRYLIGNVVSHRDSPAIVARRLKARIFVWWHPTQIVRGYKPILHIGTGHTTCAFDEILSKRQPGSESDETQPEFIRQGESGLVVLSLINPLVVEDAPGVTHLSRLIIRDHGLTVAGGVIEDVVERITQ